MHLKKPLWRTNGQSAHHLCNDVFQNDKVLSTDDLRHQILRQIQVDAAWRCNHWGIFPRRGRWILRPGQLFTQIVGFKIVAVLSVPFRALSTMVFSLTCRIPTRFLSADLTWVRHKPFATDFARPLAGSRSVHRALCCSVNGWHDIIGRLRGGSEKEPHGFFRNGGLVGPISADRWVHF